ncbi:MAG: FAD-dependent oxidoreductase [Selenomonas sp.]|uniref:FAD-dependent oxidoreductase n=1 Tax=Selenomonas sp. TaxID=2053611 RepID=UPI0025D6F6ED|nr:FAD-dependent oxidoreductase [Selenomonas sp.]MCR5758112.1 FAD-dependent oxidoreductase [Selenomonas sp.]
MTKYIVVGGVAGGATAAARLRRLNEDAEIIMVERGADISFANCGLPYFVGDTIKNREDLLVMTPERFQGLFRVDVRNNSEVMQVDAEHKEVIIKHAGQEYRESYDALLLAPGAMPLRPPIPGIDHQRIVTLRNVQDSVKLKELAAEFPQGRAVVVGGGFIGVEAAENLRQRGLAVTLVEAAPHILAPFDTDMVKLAEDELIRNDVKLILDCGVQEFLHQADNLGVKLADGQVLAADFVVLAIGVRPDTGFLKKSGIKLGERGHILVDEKMQTSAPAVYAVGDAVMTFDSQTGQAMALPLAGPANRQGRLAADNISGLSHSYRGVVGSSVLKVFDLTAASTGKNERTLQREGLVYGKDYRFTITYPADHATYYPGAEPFALKMLFSLKDGRVLGAQAIGKKGVDKRIDVLAAVLRFGGTVQDLIDLELTYAPPFSSAKDPVNMAGYYAENILAGLVNPLLPRELTEALADGAQVIDLRDPTGFAQGHIEGAINIPTIKLRDSLEKLPQDKLLILACKTGLNGYFMERMLKQAGFNARSLMGGNTYLAGKLPQ